MSDSILHKGWRISNLPRKYAASAYDRAREEVIAKAIKNPDVVAIMDFGVEQYPGISDIDFYIIFRKEAKHMHIPFEPGYSPDTEYLMMHTTLLMSEEFLSQIRYFNPWSVYAKERYLYRRDSFVPPTIDELPAVDPMLSAAFMYDKIESILSTMPSYVNKGLPVRNIFELCKNAIYAMWRLDDLGIAIPEKYRTFIRELDLLREQWFTMPESDAIDKLIVLYTQTLTYTFEIAWKLDQWLGDKISFQPADALPMRKTHWPFRSAWETAGNALYVHTFKYARMFTDVKISPAEAMELSVSAAEHVRIRFAGRIRKEIVLTPILLPWRLAAFETATVREKGILGTALSKDTFTNAKEVPVVATPSLLRRIRQQNALTEVYRAKRIPGGEGKGYIYGNQLYGYLFGEERYARKVLITYLRLRFFRNLSRVFTHRKSS